MVVSRNIAVERGATKPDKVWRFSYQGQPFNGSGSVFVLTIKCGSSTIHKSTADADGLSYDNQTGRLRWHRTIAESRIIGVGRSGNYEIERRYGADQSVLIEGVVIGKAGLNDDT